MLLYINGAIPALTSTDSTSFAGSLTTTANFQVGARDGAQQPYYGNISNALVYSRGLAASEILMNFNVQKSRFGY
jgi:hypothetical protein